MKIRWQSWSTAFAYTIVGIIFYNVTPKFHKIYIDLLEGEPIPLLSQIVTYYPIAWLALPMIGIFLIIKDIYSPENKKWLNWPYAISLLALIFIVVCAMFYPLTVIRRGIGIHN